MIVLLPLIAAGHRHPRCLLCHALPAQGLAHDLAAVGPAPPEVDGCCVCVRCGAAVAAGRGYPDTVLRRRLRRADAQVAALRRRALRPGIGGAARMRALRAVEDAGTARECIVQLLGQAWVCLGLDQGLWDGRRLSAPWSAGQRALLVRHGWREGRMVWGG